MNNVVSEVRIVLDAITRRLGQTTRFHLGRVGERDAARFHTTLQGAVAGGEARVAAELVHPLLVTSVLAWGDGPIETDLMADGNSKDTFAGLELGGLRMMGGGQELTFHRDVDYDADLWMDVAVESAELKTGRSGEFIAMRLTREYTDSDGRAYITCRETFLAR